MSLGSVQIIINEKDHLCWIGMSYFENYDIEFLDGNLLRIHVAGYNPETEHWDINTFLFSNWFITYVHE